VSQYERANLSGQRDLSGAEEKLEKEEPQMTEDEKDCGATQINSVSSRETFA